MPKYEIRVKAQYDLEICAENKADAEEQAIDHFHDYYEVKSVEIQELYEIKSTKKEAN